MKLSIRDGCFYVDNLKLCNCEVGNGRPNLPTGCYPVETQYAHVHGKTFPDAVGLGWIGDLVWCDVILGHVFSRDGLIPSTNPVRRLLALLEVSEGRGETVMLEVE